MTTNAILATFVISLPPSLFLIFGCSQMENNPFLQKNPGSRFSFSIIGKGKEIGQVCLGKRLGENGKERFQGEKSTLFPFSPQP
jgi:hypothetical protein